MSKETAILVDWDLYRTNPYTQDFVLQRAGQSRLVLLVDNPDEHDFDYEETPSDVIFPMPNIEWDAVIRNTGGHTNVIFKRKAIEVIQSISSMIPVIILDPSHTVNQDARKAGVLITIEDL